MTYKSGQAMLAVRRETGEAFKDFRDLNRLTSDEALAYLLDRALAEEQDTLRRDK